MLSGKFFLSVLKAFWLFMKTLGRFKETVHYRFLQYKPFYISVPTEMFRCISFCFEETCWIITLFCKPGNFNPKIGILWNRLLKLSMVARLHTVQKRTLLCALRFIGKWIGTLTIFLESNYKSVNLSVEPILISQKLVNLIVHVNGQSVLMTYL